MSERRLGLVRACQQGETIIRSLTIKEQRDVDAGRAAANLQNFLGSPLKPSFISESDSILFYKLKKSAALVGVASGHGFLISRLPSAIPNIINWSAPCFVSIRLTSLGLSLGRRSVRSFTACMTRDVRRQLASKGSISEAGLEIAFSAGTSLQDRAELLGGSCTGGMVGTVGVNRTSGTLVDLSFGGGSLRVDAAKNAAVYGSDASVDSILGGKVEPPGEMQPLYAIINQIVNHVERTSAPARVSASLERATAGFDPDRRIVLDDGKVKEPSSHGGKAFAARESASDLHPGKGGSAGAAGAAAEAAADSASVPSNASGSSAGGRVVQVDAEELERLKAEAAEAAALRAQLAALRA